MPEAPRARTYHLTRPDGVGFLRHWSARQAAVGFVGLFLALSALRISGALGLRIGLRPTRPKKAARPQ